MSTEIELLSIKELLKLEPDERWRKYQELDEYLHGTLGQFSKKRGDYIEKLIMPYCAPIFWWRPGTPIYHDVNLRSGTCFICNTRNRLILITAKHVFDEYRKHKDQDKSIFATIGKNLRLNLVDRYISSGTRSDIATFDVSEADLEAYGYNVFDDWPPVGIEPDTEIVFAGYPKLGRKLNVKKRYIDFKSYFHSGLVASVSQDRITCAIELEMCFGENKPEPGMFIGGMSGGPAFGLSKFWPPRLQLCGVVSDGTEAYDAVYFAKARAIDEYGLIDDDKFIP